MKIVLIEISQYLVDLKKFLKIEDLVTFFVNIGEQNCRFKKMRKYITIIQYITDSNSQYLPVFR